MNVVKAYTHGFWIIAFLEKDGSFEYYEVHNSDWTRYWQGEKAITFESIKAFIDDPENETVGFDCGCCDSLEEIINLWLEDTFGMIPVKEK